MNRPKRTRQRPRRKKSLLKLRPLRQRDRSRRLMQQLSASVKKLNRLSVKDRKLRLRLSVSVRRPRRQSVRDRQLRPLQKRND